MPSSHATILAGKADSRLSDEAVADRARQGGRRAFEDLVARYRHRIFRLAMRLSRNFSDAEEITQETFLHAHRGMASFDARARFGTWLYRIAVNEALMRRRAAGRRPTQSLEVLGANGGEVGRGLHADQSGIQVEELLDRKQLAERVHLALNALDEGSRVVLVLRDLEELSADEAARVLGISSEAVRQRTHRARRKMRQQWHERL
jgi:RNA polymerase sigma-70 factor (ECF subfamily)